MSSGHIPSNEPGRKAASGWAFGRFVAKGAMTSLFHAGRTRRAFPGLRRSAKMGSARKIIALVLVGLFAFPMTMLGKRLPAPVVEPVVHKGVRYTVPNDKGTRGYDHDGEGQQRVVSCLDGVIGKISRSTCAIR